MATVTLKGTPTPTSGELPNVGDKIPSFDLTASDLSTVKDTDFENTRLVLNIFPSLDTGVCAASVREFNKRASSFDNTTVLCISKDLPFAQQRFCAAEGLDNVEPLSAFRSSFGQDYGVLLEDGPMKGLLGRAVIVVDAEGTVLYTQLVDEISTEPDYDAAEAALED